MTVRQGPTSLNHGGDNFTDDDVQDYGDTLLATGVSQYANIDGAIGDDLEVTVGTGLHVQVGTGQAWIRGVWYKQDAPITVALSAADPTFARYDLIVLRKDKSANPMVSITKVTGTPGGSPVPPTPTQNETVWELVLCRVHVVAGATTLSGGDLNDQRLYASTRIPDYSIPSGKMADGAIDDDAIGTRTINDSLTTSGNEDTLQNLLSELANMLTQIKGDSNPWYETSPSTQSLYYLAASLSDAPKTRVHNTHFHVTDTSDVDYCGYSDLDSTTKLGMFVAYLSFFYKNATPQKVAARARFWDPDLAGFTNVYFELESPTGNAGQILNGSQSSTTGNNQQCSCKPIPFYADASHGIEIHFQDGGGTPDGHVSVALVQLGHD